MADSGNGFLFKILDSLMERREDELLRAMAKVNEGGDFEDIDTIVTDYFYLVKKLAGRKKPSGVSLKGHNTLIIDGEPHILYQEIRHNDARNTERCMEIEALFSDRIPADEVEKRLNEMIRTQW